MLVVPGQVVVPSPEAVSLTYAVHRNGVGHTRIEDRESGRVMRLDTPAVGRIADTVHRVLGLATAPPGPGREPPCVLAHLGLDRVVQVTLEAGGTVTPGDIERIWPTEPGDCLPPDLLAWFDEGSLARWVFDRLPEP